jgi:hypothetical protein
LSQRQPHICRRVGTLNLHRSYTDHSGLDWGNQTDFIDSGHFCLEVPGTPHIAAYRRVLSSGMRLHNIAEVAANRHN